LGELWSLRRSIQKSFGGRLKVILAQAFTRDGGAFRKLEPPLGGAEPPPGGAVAAVAISPVIRRAPRVVLLNRR
jgi:hypothetical protein